jgi:hypothetical protein
MFSVGVLRALALAIVLWSPAAWAGPILDDATTAESELAAGRPVQALAAIEDAFNQAWDAAPLSFSEALFVTDRPAGFGIYESRPTSVFTADEPMLVYAEPFGYGFGKQDELFKIDFSADFELRTAKGQILHSQAGFASLDMTSRRRNKEFQVFIVYRFKGLKPGDYVLVTTLHDRNSTKSGNFELPFTIAAAAPKPAAPAQ